MIESILTAVIASVPGILLGAAALRKSKRGTPEAVRCLEIKLNGTRAELKEAQGKIVELERRVDDCDRERRILMRENLELYRRVDKANET